jgi:hypothetical protein
MAAVKTKSKSWAKLGTIRQGENKGTGEKYSYIKLNDNVDIFVDGEKVSVNEKRTLRLEKPTDTVNQLLSRGVITEQQAGERLEKLAEMTWLKYEITIPPART